MTTLFKGYVPTKNKKCLMKFKNQKLKTIDEVENLNEFAGILEENIILIDIDDPEQSEIMMQIVEDKQLDCRVYKTTRGKHFLFKNTDVDQCYTGVKLACGITADIKVGSRNSYEILKFNGVDRFIEWDVDYGSDYQELPSFFKPVRTTYDFYNMEDGDGRNSALFSYELVLQTNGLTKNEAKETIRIINHYLFQDALSESELETVIRDEAFAKPIFFKDKKFLHHEFAKFLQSEFYVKRINGQLHCYHDGIYECGYRMLESKMIEILPNLKQNQRTEVLKYLEIITPTNTHISDANLIAFRNGVFDLKDHEMVPFSPNYIITNKIPWDYNPYAYDQLADKTLNKIACNDEDIRSLLEECIGYCFFRQNELSKAFMLTGSGANGKSTYLDMVKHVLGRDNYVSLDMDELSEKFSTSAMVGKLANIGDDISDEFMQGRAVAQFKKIVSGNDIKAENKGQDIFFFKPTVKLLFSANEIPRFRNKGFKAIKRRMVIIPFNATFSKDDEDFDPGITWKLKTQEVAEYLIQLGLNGLDRVLENHGFTESNKVVEEIEEFELDNNPILLFLKELDPEVDILHVPTKDVFRRYEVFCSESGYQKPTRRGFTREVCSILNYESVQNQQIKSRPYCFERKI